MSRPCVWPSPVEVLCVSIVVSLCQVSQFLKKQATAEDIEQEDPQTHEQMLDDIFQQEDQDKDGYISHEEFTAPKHEEL